MPQPVYLDIAAHYLEIAGLAFDDEARAAALRFSSERGGRSGRVAYQFSRYYIGMKGLESTTYNKYLYGLAFIINY